VVVVEEDEEEDEEVAECAATWQRLELKCALSRTRLTQPSKGSACSQCVDASNHRAPHTHKASA
jgi:hypothetical protein